MSSEVINLLQRLIQNACVNTGSADSGHEHCSVATLQEFFGAKGEVFEPHRDANRSYTASRAPIRRRHP